MTKLILIFILVFTTILYADHTKHQVTQENLPALCSTPEGIAAYIIHAGLKPVKISLGREAMDIDGKPVFMVTQFESEDGSQSAAIIDIPSGTQSCLMYHTFDLTKIE